MPISRLPQYVGATSGAAAARDVSPPPIAIPVVIPAPTVVYAVAISPSPIAVPVVLPAPTVVYGTAVVPVPITIPVVLPAPTVAGVSFATNVVPTPIAIPVLVPVVTVDGQKRFVNGMVIYNSILERFEFYEDGAWVSGSGLK